MLWGPRERATYCGEWEEDGSGSGEMVHRGRRPWGTDTMRVPGSWKEAWEQWGWELGGRGPRDTCGIWEYADSLLLLPRF